MTFINPHNTHNELLIVHSWQINKNTVLLCVGFFFFVRRQAVLAYVMQCDWINYIKHSHEMKLDKKKTIEVIKTLDIDLFPRAGKQIDLTTRDFLS